MKQVTDIITSSKGSLCLNLNWWNRLRVFLGAPLTIEVRRVTTLTQVQSAYTVFIGLDEVTNAISPPENIHSTDNTPALPWCEIIE